MRTESRGWTLASQAVRRSARLPARPRGSCLDLGRLALTRPGFQHKASPGVPRPHRPTRQRGAGHFATLRPRIRAGHSDTQPPTPRGPRSASQSSADQGGFFTAPRASKSRPSLIFPSLIRMMDHAVQNDTQKLGSSPNPAQAGCATLREGRGRDGQRHIPIVSLYLRMWANEAWEAGLPLARCCGPFSDLLG